MATNDDTAIEPANTDTTQDLNAAALATLEAAALKAVESGGPPAETPAAPPEAPVAPSAADVDLTRRIAEVVAMESKMLEEKRALKETSDRVTAELTELKAKFEAREAQLRDEPLKVLEAHQWDLESLVRAHLHGSTPEAVKQTRLEREIAEIKAEQRKRDEASTAAQRAREAAEAERTIKTVEIPKQLKLIEDNIPTIRAWFGDEGLVDVVFNLMGQEYERTKGANYLEPQEAARLLEEQAVERIKRLPGALVTPPQQQGSSNKPVVAPSATLTNKHTQHSSNSEVIDPTDTQALDRRALEQIQALLQKRN